MAASANGVKMEDAIQIKDEPAEAATPMSIISDDADEEDEEEDTGELTMPKSESDFQGFFLARVPKELWQTLVDTPGDLDEPIRIGTIRTWQKSGEPFPKMHLLLNPDLPGSELVPKEYEFSVQEPNSKNTYVFSEKDQPGYKSGAGSGLRSMQNKDKVHKSGNMRNGRGGRRSIPKRTALVGEARHEFSLHPIENEEYIRIQREKEKRMRESEVTIGDLVETSSRRVDDIKSAQQWQNFTARQKKEDKKKRQMDKAQRMPQDQLIDALVALFHEYPYWYFRSLVQRLHQPEAYVKDTLALVASLVKAGPFANTYTLQQNFRKLDEFGENFWQEGKVAPEAKEEDSDVDGKDDEDTKDEDDDDGPMEDVLR